MRSRLLVALWGSWIWAAVLSLMLLYGIRLNLTIVRRVAGRIEEKRRIPGQLGPLKKR